MSAASLRLVLGLLACGAASCAEAPQVTERTSTPLSTQKVVVDQCKNTLQLPTTGVYVVTPLNKALPESIVALPSIDGIAIRVGWRELQPTAQPPNFAIVDQQVAAARRHNKKVSLSFEAAIETPDWVFDLGARPYWFVLDEESHICERRRLPLPWDPVYLDSLKQFVRSASQRYNRSDILAHVKVTGLGGRRQSTALPHRGVRTLSDGRKTCQTTDEIVDWQNVGYSRTRIVQAWKEHLELFTQSFTSHRLAVVIDAQGLPQLDDKGQFISAAQYDPEVVPELIKLAITGRESRILVQSNELTNASSYPFPIRFGEDILLGYQLRWAVSSDKEFKMNGGTEEGSVAIFDSTIRRAVSTRGRYVEVQGADAADPQLAASLAGARVLLRQGGR